MAILKLIMEGRDQKLLETGGFILLPALATWNTMDFKSGCCFMGWNKAISAGGTIHAYRPSIIHGAGPLLVPQKHCVGQGKKSGVSSTEANVLMESQAFPAGLGIGVSWQVNIELCWPAPSVGLSCYCLCLHAWFEGTFKSSQSLMSSASPGKDKREL